MKQTKSDYEEYLDKYCQKHRIIRAEAEQHYLVKEYKKMCEEREREHEENLGCGSDIK